MLPKETKISEIMSTPVFVIDSTETIQNAAIMMRKKNIEGLIVIHKKEVEGLITNRDIVNKVVAENIKPQTMTVNDIMAPKIITAYPDETITDISKKMYANTVSRIPIIDKNENLVGIVTKTDITKVCPAMVEVLYEKAIIEEAPFGHERKLMDGRCEECGNAYTDLVDVQGLWLCRSCSEDKTVIGSKKLGL
ncbi:CBS domain-containing protein [archaeon]|nr:CBS domain-containing protein [archaeon]